MEAAVRTAHYLLTGQELAKLEIQPLRGMKGAKELRAKIGDLEVGAAVVSGLGNARKLLDEIRAGRKDLHFIEVMTCPGGCINGGGQPIGADMNAARARMQALYKIDQNEKLRVSHKNLGRAAVRGVPRQAARREEPQPAAHPLQLAGMFCSRSRRCRSGAADSMVDRKQGRLRE